MSQASMSMSESPSVSGIHSVPPGPALMQLLLGAIIVPMVSTAVELGYISALAAGPKTFTEIAQKCSTPVDATHRLLRALSTVGIVLEHTDGRFSLLPMGECLLPDVPGSFEALVRLNGSDWCGSVYLGLAEAVKTGESAFTRRHGEGIFSWLSKHPTERELFARAMSTFTGMEANWVLDAYDFSKCAHIVDVGGGKGLLIASVLNRAVDSRGTLFDLPEVIATSANSFSPETLSRCQIQGGSFFEGVPAGGDLYILKHILHDWDDAHAEEILLHVSRALRPGGKVLVIEQGIAPPGIPNPGKIMDIAMMALVDGGRERSTDEHAALMRKVGLRFERTIQTPGNITLFEGSR